MPDHQVDRHQRPSCCPSVKIPTMLSANQCACYHAAYPSILPPITPPPPLQGVQYRDVDISVGLHSEYNCSLVRIIKDRCCVHMCQEWVMNVSETSQKRARNEPEID